MTSKEVSFDAHHGQQLVLADKHRFMTLVCGRRWGKDHLACIKILSHSLSHVSPRGGKIYAWLNPVYNPQGKESFRVLKMFAESGGLVQKTIETPPMEVRLINGDKIVFFSADQPDNLRGGQYDGVIINEAGLISDLDDLWSGPVAAMLLDRAGWAWLQGTPKGKGPLHKFFLRGLTDVTDKGKPNPWKSFRFPTKTNPFIPPEELERLKDELPEDIFQQEFLAEFLDSGGAVFRGLDIMRSRSENAVILPQSDMCRVGVDLAKHTDFTVCVAMDPASNVVGFDRFNNLDWGIVTERIERFCSRYRGTVVLDASGVGDPIYDNLTGKGLAIRPVKFTNERKVKMVQNLMLLIEEGILKIPWPNSSHGIANSTEHIWQELEAYSYTITSTGRIRYEAPKGFHDDCVTALFLAASELAPQMSAHEMYQSLDLEREIGQASHDY
tara:strand:- start:7626 stop:8948 length:1323 start_codon:yes stop_codon:yes gene_type:complete